MFKSCFKGLPDHLGTSPLLQPRTPSSKAKLEEITKQFKCSEKAVQMIQMRWNAAFLRICLLPNFLASWPLLYRPTSPHCADYLMLSHLPTADATCSSCENGNVLPVKIQATHPLLELNATGCKSFIEYLGMWGHSSTSLAVNSGR